MFNSFPFLLFFVFRCIVYLGHIPVFADIHLSRYFNVPNTEPGWFAEIFERGIDPNLDDPTKCNDHSPFPEEENKWPSLDAVLSFRDKLRQRLTEVYRGLGKEPGSQIQLTRRLGRVLAMVSHWSKPLSIPALASKISFSSC